MLDCRDLGSKAGAPEDTRHIVVVGNPNVGKTALFNAITGIYGDVSNFPGTTVDMCYGRMGRDIIIDTPGVYGISTLTGAEKLVRDLVLSADIVVDVVEAANLERDLFLTLHLIDLGIPLVVALNMSDETARHGLKISREMLENTLGVPVVSTAAVKKEGIETLIKKLAQARKGLRDPFLETKLPEMAGELGTTEAMALLLMEGDVITAGELALPPGKERMFIYRKRRERVDQIVDQVRVDTRPGKDFLDVLGQAMIRPITGFPILIAVMSVMYLLVGVFFAQIVVDFTQRHLMEGYYEPFVRTLVSSYISLDSPIGDMLTGQFGLLTMAVTYVLGLLTPLVFGFFLVLSILEDSGYLPRVAILMDRLMSVIGLNGLAVIPLVLGFGCVTAATITTRLLPTDRERRIAIFLLALTVPCSAQLAFVTALMSRLGAAYFILYVLIVFGVMVTAGIVMARVMPGATTPLLLNLPGLRVPRPDNVIIKTWMRSWQFIKEAFPLFVGGSLFLSLLRVTGMLGRIQSAMEPVTVGWLGLPRESASAFIMGLIRRDFGTAGILAIPMSTGEQFVAMVSLTLFVPCIASVMIIFKERGWKEGIIMWASVLLLAFLIGGLVSRLQGLMVGIGGDNAPLLMIGAVTLFMSGILVVTANGKRV